MKGCGEIQQGVSNTLVHTQAMDPSPRNQLAANLSPPWVRKGMSIVELVLAILVLSVGLMTAVGGISSLRGVRAQAEETVSVQSIVYGLGERFQGARWDNIGVAPWSLARLEEGAGVVPDNLPMIDDTDMKSLDVNQDATVSGSELATRSSRGLQSLGIISEPARVSDLKIYIEYYRAVTARDGDGNPTGPVGLMSGEDASFANVEVGDFANALRFDLRQEGLDILHAGTRASVLTNRAKYRLDQSLPPTGQVGENEPIVIRILATWSTRVGDRTSPSGQLSIITSRKP